METETIFILAVLLVFVVLDIIMLVSLLKPGDERNQIIVWKAGSTTLFVTAAVILLGWIVGFITRKPFFVNTIFFQLGSTVITYFISLIYHKKRYGG